MTGQSATTDLEAGRARPIVKWVGGKTKLLPELLQRLPATYGRYYEPFAGGAALFFRLDPERAVVNDLNADLIGMYRAVAEDVDGLAVLLGSFAADHSEVFYARIRSEWNARAFDADPTARAAAMLYLNRACFNGLWRVNARGAMNSPIGRRSDGSLNAIDFDVDNLRVASAMLARADLRCGSYAAAVADAERGDLVYLDSPYDATGTPWTRKARNFTAYGPDAFGPEQQCELAGVVRDLIARGCHVIASNSDTPLVRQLYAGLRIDVVQRPGTVNSDGAKRGKVDEVIIVGTPAPRRVRAHAREQMSLPGGAA